MSQPTAAQGQPHFEITTSRQFESWLAESGASLAVSTYQVGKVFLFGSKPDKRLSIYERTLERTMGLAASKTDLWIASLYQLWRFRDFLEPGEAYEGHDRLFVPQQSWVTGDLDIHDVHLTADDEPIFVNTLFSCLARPSPSGSFQPVWRPPFISRLAAEDRCHLNGLAMRAGAPAFVTAVAPTDIADGWRDRREDGGVVVDVTSGEVVCTGLSMPHSPRWHRDRLWILNAGSGEFGSVDLATGLFEPLCFCPGYLRGLTFIDQYAVVATSLARENRTFAGLALDARLEAEGVEPRCGLWVIDLATGDIVHWLRFHGLITELYDVIALPGTRRPALIGFRTDEIRRLIRIDESGEGAL
ncbi:MAG: TIGR03032 family protein [Pseudomonadota bacterium]